MVVGARGNVPLPISPSLSVKHQWQDLEPTEVRHIGLCDWNICVAQPEELEPTYQAQKWGQILNYDSAEKPRCNFLFYVL